MKELFLAGRVLLGGFFLFNGAHHFTSVTSMAAYTAAKGVPAPMAAVLVSGLTTIAGFGSLMVAKHQGTESLGYVMAVGTTTCMLVGLTFLPALLNLLDKAGWTMKKTQRDNAQSTLGREEPR